MSISAKLTSKGQITLPIELRRALGVKPGDRISFRKTDQGNYELVAKSKTLAELHGIIPYDGPPRSIGQILEDIEEAQRHVGEDVVRSLKSANKE